jgi:hypothetical protein
VAGIQVRREPENLCAIRLEPMAQDLDLSLEGTSHTSATTVDAVTYPTQVPDVSYGRDPALPATWIQFAHSTPGAENALFTG